MKAPAVVLSTPQPPHEIADIFREYGPDYREQFHPSHEQEQVMRAIEQCRTAALGGHVDECDQCGTLRVSYNSCRNRHCPKCGALTQARWIEARQVDLLPVPYFHVVFTLDHAIHPLARCNPQAIYDALFATAAQTLKEFSAQYLKGDLGFVAVLHTWGQDLGQHLHLHCIVTGGALSFDQSRWQPCPTGFLFPVLPLSRAFRDKFCQALALLHQRGQLIFAGECAELEQPESMHRLLTKLQAKKWEVYIQEALPGPEPVMTYLGRYVQRTAISNHRIVAIRDGQVSFRWRDNRHGGRPGVMTLSAVEFIRRFLLHVLPSGFVRIRYFGLLGNHERSTRLRRCRELLGVPSVPPPVTRENTQALLMRLTGVDVRRCPVCGIGTMARKQHLDPVYELFSQTSPMPRPLFVEALVG